MSSKRYRRIRTIGRGTYGTAILVEDTAHDDERFVMKQLAFQEMSSNEQHQAVQEVALLEALDHPNIVKYHDSFTSQGELFIVMQYCSGGDLARKLRKAQQASVKFSEEQILDWFTQIVSAIDYVHKRRVLHRDLKTSNVFLTKSNMIKLGDFGIAKVLEHTMDQANTVTGTPYYMSPEVCENKPYNYASDVFALGCILYELCTLKHAFEAPNLLALVYQIVTKNPDPIPEYYSSELQSLVCKLLDKDPLKRPTAGQILEMPIIRSAREALAASGGTVGQEIQKLPAHYDGSSVSHSATGAATSISSHGSTREVSPETIATPRSQAVAASQKPKTSSAVVRLREKRAHEIAVREKKLREAAIANARENVQNAQRGRRATFEPSSDSPLTRRGTRNTLSSSVRKGSPQVGRRSLSTAYKSTTGDVISNHDTTDATGVESELRHGYPNLSGAPHGLDSAEDPLWAPADIETSSDEDHYNAVGARSADHPERIQWSWEEQTVGGQAPSNGYQGARPSRLAVGKVGKVATHESWVPSSAPTPYAFAHAKQVPQKKNTMDKQPADMYHGEIQSIAESSPGLDRYSDDSYSDDFEDLDEIETTFHTVPTGAPGMRRRGRSSSNLKVPKRESNSTEDRDRLMQQYRRDLDKPPQRRNSAKSSPRPKSPPEAPEPVLMQLNIRQQAVQDTISRCKRILGSDYDYVYDFWVRAHKEGRVSREPRQLRSEIMERYGHDRKKLETVYEVDTLVALQTEADNVMPPSVTNLRI